MMRKYTFFAFLLFVASGLSAQLINDGGVIVIQSGATLVVEGDIDNNNSGSITNNGTIQVEKNFTNSATLTSAAASEIIFTGAVNSEFTTGGAMLAVVKNTKTAGDVVLMDNMTVSEAVNFVGTSNIVLGADSVILADGAITDATDATGWFVTDGVGTLNRFTDAAGTSDFHVGDATNFSPLSIVHSGTYTADQSKLSARVTNSDHPNLLADADSYLSRYWTVNATDITGYSGNMEGTFVAGDENGTGDIVGARYENSAWEFGTGAATATTVTATSTSDASELTGKNFFGKADLAVYLQGPYSGGTMTQNLTLPLTSPYTDAPLTVTAVPAGAVDWIKIEARDVVTPATVLGKTSAFVLFDGSIVDENGQNPLIKDAAANSVVAIYHRNHLPMRSAGGLNLENPSFYDFSTGLSQAYDNSALSNDAMLDLGSGVYGMYRANVNGDTNINIVDFILAKQNTTPSQAGVYNHYDINMDGNVNIIDFILAKASTNPSRVAHL